MEEMNRGPISIRLATAEDAATIARAVAMAIGNEESLRAYCGEEYLTLLTEIAALAATQYSWQQALIAEVEGSPAGAIVGYDGAQLAALREGTFSVLRKRLGRQPYISNETEAGEYYLDSVAVWPEYRGLGIGRELIEAFCERARHKGHERVGLIVDCENPTAERLYLSLGFERVDSRLFFGHRMWHLQRRCKK